MTAEEEKVVEILKQLPRPRGPRPGAYIIGVDLDAEKVQWSCGFRTALFACRHTYAEVKT